MDTMKFKQLNAADSTNFVPYQVIGIDKSTSASPMGKDSETVKIACQPVESDGVINADSIQTLVLFKQDNKKSLFDTFANLLANEAALTRFKDSGYYGIVQGANWGVKAKPHYLTRYNKDTKQRERVTIEFSYDKTKIGQPAVNSSGITVFTLKGQDHHAIISKRLASLDYVVDNSTPDNSGDDILAA